MTRACRRRTGEAPPRADKFGELITATITGTLSWYKIQPLNGLHLIRAKQNLDMRRKKVYQNSFEASCRPKVVYTDNSMEFGKACEGFSWNHRTSTPHRSETSGIAERAVRRAKEGTSKFNLEESTRKRTDNTKR